MVNRRFSRTQTVKKGGASRLLFPTRVAFFKCFRLTQQLGKHGSLRAIQVPRTREVA